MKLDAAQSMKLIEVDKDGNSPMQHYPELEADLLEDAERYKVPLEQEAAQQAIEVLGAPPTTRSSLDDSKAAVILNFTSQPVQFQPLKKNVQPRHKKKAKTAPKASATQTTVSALRRQQETLFAMASTPTANASAAQNASGDHGKDKQPADDEQPSKKKGQSKSAKRRAAKKRADAVKAAATFGGNLQNVAAEQSASVAPPDPGPSTSAYGASASAMTVGLARAYQAQIEEDDPEDGDSQDVTTESEDVLESAASATNDHDHGECTCNCEAGRLYLNGDEIQTYDPTLMTDFAAKHSQLRTLIVAAELKLRADHLHNIWFGCIAAVRKCDCGPCSAPYSPCYEWIARPAKEEYWAANKKVDEFLEQKKTQLAKEVIAIIRPEGRAEKAKMNSYLKHRNLPKGMIKRLLPDGRDKNVEVRGRGKFPLIPVNFYLNI